MPEHRLVTVGGIFSTFCLLGLCANFLSYVLFWVCVCLRFVNNVSFVLGHLTSPNPSFFVVIVGFIWLFGRSRVRWGLNGPSSPDPPYGFVFVFVF